MQPIPDDVRWLQTGGEMKTQVVNNTPAAFLPSQILERTYKVFSFGVEKILPCVAFISWCTEKDVNMFFKDFKEEKDKSFLKRESIGHNTNFFNRKARTSCRPYVDRKKLPAEGKMHECVNCLLEKMESTPPPPTQFCAGINHRYF